MTALVGPDAGSWPTLAPHFAALREDELTAEGVPAWLARWSDLQRAVWEARAALKRDRLRDLTDEAADRAFSRFTAEVMAPFEAANRELAGKLLAVPGYAPPPELAPALRQLRAAADLAGAGNAALASSIATRAGEHQRIAASLTVTIDGRELTGPELDRRLRDPDRATREAAWRASNAAWLAYRERLDELFLALLMARRRLARAAGLPDYRAYRWRELGRLDYTPADALALHRAIAEAIVPLAAGRQEARRDRLGMPALRPWDLDVDPDARPPLQPFPDLAAFEAGMAGVFAHLDPELGALFERMRDGYLDLGWRRGKSGGGEEWAFPVTGLPYVLVNADGTADGVNLLLHEMGHAFHDYLILSRAKDRSRGGLIWESHYPDEMAEFAAIALSHLAAPYLARDRGGCYSPEDAARVRAAALEEIVAKWLPHIATLDAFQHWLYAEAPAAVGPADLDAAWRELSSRFSPWVDWSGLETEQGAGWQRAGLLFTQPFYSLEYALAHLGALQVWRNAQSDPDAAWRAYRSALALGNTRPLPALYQAAGARLPFDRAVVRDVAQTLAAHLDADPIWA